MEASLWMWVPGSVYPSRYHHSAKEKEPRWKISKEHLEDFSAPFKYTKLQNINISETADVQLIPATIHCQTPPKTHIPEMLFLWKYGREMQNNEQ